MCGIVASSSKQEVLEMMSSICYYYNEFLYCQSFQVRLEVNKRSSKYSIITYSAEECWRHSSVGYWQVCKTVYRCTSNLHVGCERSCQEL